MVLLTLTVLENVELIKDVTKNGVDSKEAIKAVGRTWLLQLGEEFKGSSTTGNGRI